MPCLDVKVNVDDELYKKEGANFIKQITDELAKILNKPSAYLMVSLTNNMISMGGNLDEPTAWTKLEYLGQTNKLNANDKLALNKQISQCVASNLDKFFKINKYFLVISDIERINWGYNGDIPFYTPPKQNDEQKST